MQLQQFSSGLQTSLSRRSENFAANMESHSEKLILKRQVGLIGAVSLIAGTMIGSGIFMSPQSVLLSIGSPGASLVIWACCGLLAVLGSLCYAELGTVIRESGGEYIYILRTSGPVVAFMLIFSSVVFVRPAGVAGISLSFAQYTVAPFYPDCPPPQLVVKCVAASGIILLATVNCLNVRFSMSIQVFFMVTKVLALVVIVVGGGVVLISGGQTDSFRDSFENTNVGINPIGIAFYQGLWSYDGWNNLNYVTEELKRPEVKQNYIFPNPNFVLCKYDKLQELAADRWTSYSGSFLPGVSVNGQRQNLNLIRKMLRVTSYSIPY